MNQWESELKIKILSGFILFHSFKDLSVFAVTFIHLGFCKLKKMLITEKICIYTVYINRIRYII